MNIYVSEFIPIQVIFPLTTVIGNCIIIIIIIFFLVHVFGQWRKAGVLGGYPCGHKEDKQTRGPESALLLWQC